MGRGWRKVAQLGHGSPIWRLNQRHKHIYKSGKNASGCLHSSDNNPWPSGHASLLHAPAAIALRAPSANCSTIRAISGWSSSRGTGYAAAWPEGVYTWAARGRGISGPPAFESIGRSGCCLPKPDATPWRAADRQQWRSNDHQPRARLPVRADCDGGRRGRRRPACSRSRAFISRTEARRGQYWRFTPLPAAGADRPAYTDCRGPWPMHLFSFRREVLLSSMQIRSMQTGRYCEYRHAGLTDEPQRRWWGGPRRSTSCATRDESQICPVRGVSLCRNIQEPVRCNLQVGHPLAPVWLVVWVGCPSAVPELQVEDPAGGVDSIYHRSPCLHNQALPHCSRTAGAGLQSVRCDT